jgi:hypothetical protein
VADRIRRQECLDDQELPADVRPAERQEGGDTFRELWSAALKLFMRVKADVHVQ